jgi:hypothetical protein
MLKKMQPFYQHRLPSALLAQLINKRWHCYMRMAKRLAQTNSRPMSSSAVAITRQLSHHPRPFASHMPFRITHALLHHPRLRAQSHH